MIIEVVLFVFFIVLIHFFYTRIILQKRKNNDLQKHHEKIDQKYHNRNTSLLMHILNISLTKMHEDQLNLYFHSIDTNDNNFLKMLNKLFPFQHKQQTNQIPSCSFVLVPSFYLLLLKKELPEYQASSIKNIDLSFGIHYDFVCNLYEQQITCIVKKNSNIHLFPLHAKVGVIENHHSHYFLKLIKQILQLKIELIVFTTLDLMANAFTSNEIYSMFLICSHPNNFLLSFSLHTEITFFNICSILTKDTSTQNLVQFYFPELQKSVIRLFPYRSFNNQKLMATVKICCSFFVHKMHHHHVYIPSVLNTIFKTLQTFNNVLPFYSLVLDHVHVSPLQYQYNNEAFEFYQNKYRVLNEDLT